MVITVDLEPDDGDTVDGVALKLSDQSTDQLAYGGAKTERSALVEDLDAYILSRQALELHSKLLPPLLAVVRERVLCRQRLIEGDHHLAKKLSVPPARPAVLQARRVHRPLRTFLHFDVLGAVHPQPRPEQSQERRAAAGLHVAHDVLETLDEIFRVSGQTRGVEFYKFARHIPVSSFVFRLFTG